MGLSNFRKDPAGQQQRSVHIGGEAHVTGEENNRWTFAARCLRHDGSTVVPVWDHQDLSSRAFLLAADSVLLRDNQNTRRVRPANSVKYAEANELQEIPRTSQDP